MVRSEYAVLAVIAWGFFLFLVFRTEDYAPWPWELYRVLAGIGAAMGATFWYVHRHA